MHALKKRRFVSPYWTLPLVVAIVFGLVARLVALQRADIIAELSDSIAHSDTADASAAVRQLAAMPRPPMAILVAAAASADREVAEEARQAIDRLLRRCERQLAADRGIRNTARQLAELAAAIHEQQDSFSAADHRWLADATNKLLILANQVPAKHTPLVATHCDAILAAITSVASVSDTGVAGAGVSDPSNSLRSQPAQLQRELSPAPIGPLETTIATEAAQVGTQVSNDAAADTTIEEPIDASWRSDWSQPMFRMPPALPINATPTQDSPTSAPVSPQRAGPDAMEITDRPLAELDSRKLLQDWLASDGPRVLPVEEELARRGFSRLSERLVRQFFSEQARDRLRLVDDVLTAPGVDARPWLMLLADDADADVRLLAVTIMATSDDAALVEKAWQVAIRDRDARIAGLAARLRERREDVKRR